MDFISTNLALVAPSGFWVSILNSFKGGVGSYIVAVILVALIVRVVLSLVDIINKKVSMKNMNINAKMKPELDAIQKKYGHDQRLVQQKTSEVYKKYQFSMMSSCLPMLIMLVLQTVVFLTFWNSLQSVANYNIAEKYENMKYVYANVISLNENDEFCNLLATAGENPSLEFEISTTEDDKKQVTYKLLNNSGEKIGESTTSFNTEWTNEQIYNNYLSKYVIKPEVESSAYEPTVYSEKIRVLAEDIVESYYKENQEGFLWIKNIYKAESPTSPLFTKAEVTKYMSNFYSDEEKEIEKTNDYEGKIFDTVVAGVDQKALGLNGYYILTIIAMASSFLSIWLSNKLTNKDNPAQKPNKVMYFVMPIIFGIFTFSYTSLFAVYLIVGQLVMIALTPLTTFIVRKWNAADEKKKKEKDVVVVDYRRKDQ